MEVVWITSPLLARGFLGDKLGYPLPSLLRFGGWFESSILSKSNAHVAVPGVPATETYALPTSDEHGRDLEFDKEIFLPGGLPRRFLVGGRLFAEIVEHAPECERFATRMSAASIRPFTFPFEMPCDPQDRRMYQQLSEVLGVDPAESDGQTLAKLVDLFPSEAATLDLVQIEPPAFHPRSLVSKHLDRDRIVFNIERGVVLESQPESNWKLGLEAASKLCVAHDGFLFPRILNRFIRFSSGCTWPSLACKRDVRIRVGGKGSGAVDDDAAR